MLLASDFIGFVFSSPCVLSLLLGDTFPPLNTDFTNSDKVYCSELGLVYDVD